MAEGDLSSGLSTVHFFDWPRHRGCPRPDESFNACPPLMAAADKEANDDEQRLVCLATCEREAALYDTTVRGTCSTFRRCDRASGRETCGEPCDRPPGGHRPQCNWRAERAEHSYLCSPPNCTQCRIKKKPFFRPPDSSVVRRFLFATAAAVATAPRNSIPKPIHHFRRPVININRLPVSAQNPNASRRAAEKHAVSHFLCLCVCHPTSARQLRSFLIHFLRQMLTRKHTHSHTHTHTHTYRGEI